MIYGSKLNCHITWLACIRGKDKMPALDKNSNLYAATERVAAICKVNKMNLSADAVAAIIVETVVNEITDKAMAAKQNCEGLDWLMDEPQKKARAEVAAVIAKCVTAAKNYQNSYAAPSRLMEKAETVTADVEFV